MCGIFCAFCQKNEQIDLQSIFNPCKDIINRRGPDFETSIQLSHEDNKYLFAASILWLQGNKLTKQPLDSEFSTFVYNGDVFGGNAIKEETKRIRGDTEIFLEILEKSNEVSSTLSNIQGPYAFVFLNKRKNILYFGRDIYGRRSLLIGKKLNAIILASVLRKDINVDCIELPAIGTFCLDLNNNNFKVFPWKYKNQNFSSELEKICKFLEFKIEIKQEIELEKCLEFNIPGSSEFEDYEIVKSSFNLQYLQLNCSQNSKTIKETNKDLKPNGDLTELKVNKELNTIFRSTISYLLSRPKWVKKINKLHLLLKNALKKRISTQPPYCHNCIENRTSCNHALTGVLFSGGVDCSILAILADEFTEKTRPIDLINVAFDELKQYETPDRMTGLETLKELKLLRPERHWNFLEVNISREELDFERNSHIRHLIYPLETILDDSLGCALWFASRGKSHDYKSPCRILLVGMGADELFGGYTRHRNALKRTGLQGLHLSLDEDWQNISHRNLARDDRVVSDNGRQLRTPYLDEEFVEYVRKLNCWEKTFPSDYLPQGVGEKILLRTLAYHLGLKNASVFKKRALQFGSRIANSKENAKDLSPRL